jgi:uncharacterized protein (TIGR03083 family)
MAATDPTWNFQDPASKDRVLGVLRNEMDTTFALVADPARWQSPTACAGWQTCDVMGHLVDATEGYFPAFAAARSGDAVPEPLGLRAMPALADKNAREMGALSQDVLLKRLRDDADRMMSELTSLSADEWTGLMPSHKYMGPLPAMFYPMFQMVDYAVHRWDVQEGTGRPHMLSGDAADLLVPVIFVLWSATADTSGVQQPHSVGIRTSGQNGGDMRADVSNDGVQFTPGSIDDCAAILEFDPATLVLTGYGRINGGTVRGDPQVASNFRSLFFPI